MDAAEAARIPVQHRSCRLPRGVRDGRVRESRTTISRTLMRRWLDWLIGGVAVLTAIVFIADAVLSILSGLYLNLGSGVWLGLARDTYDGVFYRPLWSGAEYGGTRYFPMLF